MATTPTISDFRARFPVFDALPSSSIEYWLIEGFAEVSGWAATDQPLGAMAYEVQKLSERGAA